MSFPTDLQYMVISFVPHSNFLAVSKEWYTEIKNIQKKAVSTIGSWYKKRVVYYDPEEFPNYRSVQDFVRYHILNFPSEIFINYPEHTVSKLELNECLLTVIPHVNRKRSDVRDWMLNMPISLEDWGDVDL